MNIHACRQRTEEGHNPLSYVRGPYVTWKCHLSMGLKQVEVED